MNEGASYTSINPEFLAETYWRIKRVPLEGTLAEAIRVHSQACGLIAYLFDTHPDRVAEAVRDSRCHKTVRQGLISA